MLKIKTFTYICGLIILWATFILTYMLFINVIMHMISFMIHGRTYDFASGCPLVYHEGYPKETYSNCTDRIVCYNGVDGWGFCSLISVPIALIIVMIIFCVVRFCVVMRKIIMWFCRDKWYTNITQHEEYLIGESHMIM